MSIPEIVRIGSQNYGLYLLGGLLLGIGFIWSSFWWVGLVGVPVLLHAITQSTTLRQVLIGSVLTFASKTSLAIFWFWSTYPIIWIDLALGNAELPVIGFYWVTVSLAIGLSGALFGFFLYQFKTRLGDWRSCVLVAPLWVLTEILGSIFFSIFTLGPGGSINAVFSFGYSGYLLGNHDWLLPLAAFGGVYMLSATFALLGLGMYVYWCKNKNRTRATELLACGVLLLALSAQFAVKSETANSVAPNFSVAIVDTTFGGEAYFAREDRDNYKREQLREAVTAALESGARYVVMPEDSRYLDPGLAPEIAYGYFRFQNGDPYAVVVEAGAVPLSGGEVALRASLYDGIEKKAYGVDKQYLVPQGEFMPTLYSTVLATVGAKRAAEAIEQKLQYRPGPLSVQQKLPSHLPGVLFCFASADPLSVRKLVSERSLPFVAHPISHAWFHESTSLWQQFDVMLKVHAIWNNVPIVSAGNMVSGALYTEGGVKVTGTIYTEGESWKVTLVGW